MKLVRILLLFIFLMSFLPLSKATQAASQVQATGVQIITETDSEISFSYIPPAFSINNQYVNREVCQTLDFPGAAAPSAPGKPLLPSLAVLLGVPANVDVQLEIVRADYATLPGTYSLCTYAAVQTDMTDPLAPALITGERIKEMYHADTTNNIPSLAAEILDRGFIRDQAVAQIGIYPAQYLAQQKQMRVLKSLVVKVTWAVQPALTRDAQRNVDASFDPLLSTSLINYNQAKTWRTARRFSSYQLQQAETTQKYNIGIPQAGIYAITGADLDSAAIDLASITLANLHIAYKGGELPIMIEGGEDGVLNLEDRIIFYGFPENSQYVQANTFQLYWDNQPGLRLRSIDASAVEPMPAKEYFTDKQTFNEDRIYLGAYASGVEQDHWYWDSVLANGQTTSKPFVIRLGTVPNVDQLVTLRGLIQGYAATQPYHTRIYINGHLVDEANWEIKSAYAFSVQFPSHYLVSGDNTVSVESVITGSGSYSLFYVNWFALEYPRMLAASQDRLSFLLPSGHNLFSITGFLSDQVQLFDITNRRYPQVVEGVVVAAQEAGGYAASIQQNLQEARAFIAQTTDSYLHPAAIVPASRENLTAPTNGADYIIITDPSLVETSQLLADYRAGQGLRTKVVDTRSIYDTFGFGLPDPNAIREFLRYAHQNWQSPAPLYVLLVGDGNYDYKNNAGYNEPILVPPLLYDLDPWIGQIPADNRYATIVGEDNFPDLYLGRLPVRTADELKGVITKIIGYEALPVEDWNKQALFISDNDDEGGNFTVSSDHLAAQLPGSFSISRVYYKITHLTTTEAKAAIKSNLNAGKGLVQYSGHGSHTAWASEKLFSYADIPALTNGSRLPFVVALDCMDGYFIFPKTSADNSSLAEGMIRPTDRGAISIFASTGYGIVEGHDILGSGLYKAIFQYGMNRAGAATTYAKYFLASQTVGHRELIDSFTLFGDPALVLKMGPSGQTQTPDLAVKLSLPNGPGRPGEAVDVQLDYANNGSADAVGISITLPIPDQLLDPALAAQPALEPYSDAPYRWLVNRLSPGASGRITLRARISPAAAGEFPITARISALSPDANQANNSATVSLSTNPTDLSISLRTQTAALLSPGEGLDILLDYENVGLDARNVVLSLHLPSSLLQSSVNLPSGWQERAGEPGVWSIDVLPAKSRGTILIRAQSAPQQTGVFPITADITSYSPELNPMNNHGSVSVSSFYYTFLPVVNQ